MKKLLTMLLAVSITIGILPMMAIAANNISLNESNVYNIAYAGDKIELTFKTTSNDSFYRITVKNLSINDKVYMTLYDKYDETVASFDYYAYLDKGKDNYVDNKLNRNESYRIELYASTGKQTGNIQVSVDEYVDDVPDTSANAEMLSLNETIVRRIDANKDIDYFRFHSTINDSFYRITVKNLSINDKVYMSVFDENELEVAYFDYYAYLDKSKGNYVDIKLPQNKPYVIKLWASGGKETGNYSICVDEIIDDVPDSKDTAMAVFSDKSYDKTINATSDHDFFIWRSDTTKLTITVTNNSINDKVYVKVYDKYDAELVYFDYYAYLDKTKNKSTTIDVELNERYYIEVWASGGKETGNYRLDIGTPTPDPMPSNGYAYEISAMSIERESGEILHRIPENESFIVRVSFIEKYVRNEEDYVVVAAYDASGALLDLNYIKSNFETANDLSVGVLISPQELSIANLKTFVWKGISSQVPVAESVSFN